MKNSYLAGVFLAFISGIIWGFSGVCGEYLFTNKHFDPFWLTSVRLLASGLILFAIVFTKSKFKVFAIFSDRSALFDLGLYAVLGLALCQLTYYFTISYSNAAIATTLQYTAPAMIMIFVCIKERNFPTFREFIALVFATSGIFFFATHGNFQNLVISKEALIIGLLSALCVVIYSIAPIKISQKYGTNAVLALGLIMSGGVFWIFYAIFGGEILPSIDFSAFLVICAIVFLGTICGFSLYMIAVNFIGPKRASLVASIEPLMAALFGHFWLGSKFVFFDYLGFTLIILCAVLLSKK